MIVRTTFILTVAKWHDDTHILDGCKTVIKANLWLLEPSQNLKITFAKHFFLVMAPFSQNWMSRFSKIHYYKNYIL